MHQVAMEDCVAPLFRDSWKRPEVREGRASSQPLASAQGVFNGTLIGALSWALLVAVYLLLR